MKNKVIPYKPYLKAYARELRNNSTLAEVLLWQKLKNRSFGFQFHRQVPLVSFIVDFYCHELLLAIEVDGDSHLYKYADDLQRQDQIEDYDIQVLRIQDEVVKNDMFSVELLLRETIEQRRLELELD